MSTPQPALTTETPEVTPEDVRANLISVRNRVEALAQELQLAKMPTLVAVSKFKPVSLIRAAYDAGQRHFGENYVQELEEKAPLLPRDIHWHLIGHLQSNKVSVVHIPNLAFIESVDSIKLANKLDSAMSKHRPSAPARCLSQPPPPLKQALEPSSPLTPMPVVRKGVTPASEDATAMDRLKVMVQVLTSDEERKNGVEMGAACIELCRYIRTSCPNLELLGLMTIGAPGDMGAFTSLVACRLEVAQALGLAPESLELSMGMSHDFPEAIRAGSTNVRVGTTIFGARHMTHAAAGMLPPAHPAPVPVHPTASAEAPM
ncbi:putative Pyridoxal phosphate homeostasis protein [Paratrimastix pyriformis]|uniref:Pyridoxal phosphate homeostasis protein n=1 Tax=Paratrimastix pyriformis TaxID=342808 RepID=A0ABQ8URF6_9EUKA|nr:putative Pyridoxal phosphate homeostasis protein [Paratrimastix pyriformis]